MARQTYAEYPVNGIQSLDFIVFAAKACQAQTSDFHMIEAQLYAVPNAQRTHGRSG